VRRIYKRKPGPPKLLEHRKRGGRYGDLPVDAKEQLRTALLEDQGFLCCYCMRSMHPEKGYRVRIEHHQSQSRVGERDLDWANLLAACAGSDKTRSRNKDDAASRKVPRAQQTCDYRKGDSRITINPLTSNVDAVRYLANGRVLHPDQELQHDIDECLNLNVDFLMDARKAARDRLIARLQATLGAARTWSKNQLERYLDGLRTRPRLEAFMGVLEHFLAREIARRSH
jgi:uncharacterized protein (TIGR02646 family)